MGDFARWNTYGVKKTVGDPGTDRKIVSEQGIREALDTSEAIPITNAKLANMATQTIKGRTTAETGDPEDLSATQARGILNVANGADVTDYSDIRISNSRTEGDITTISRPSGAFYVNDSAHEIGAIVITLPQSWTSTMMKFVVDVFDLNDNLSFSLNLAGYNYTTSSAWIKTTANLVGSVIADNRVRFGHDGSNCCIVIGETTSSRGYLKITVKDFQGGRSNYSIDQWDDGWTISILDDLSGYTFNSDLSNNLIGAKDTQNVNGLASATLIVSDKIGLNLVKPESIVNFAAGDLLLASADTERSAAFADVPEKVKEIYSPRAGTLRIKFDGYRAGAEGEVRVYQNGVAVGSAQAMTGSYVTYSQDISDWSAGDLVQLYITSTTDGSLTYAKNFKIYALNSLAMEVVTD